MSVDRRFERTVLAELAFRERRAQRRRRDRSGGARELAERLHSGSADLLGHLSRVASSVPESCRPVAWLHHAGEAEVTRHALAAAGLTSDEVAAVELFTSDSAPRTRPSVLRQARALSQAPGSPGRLARVVARAEIEDRLGRERAEGEMVSALALLPDPQLVR